MRTKEYWDNRYNDFCNNVLGSEISYYQTSMYCIVNEISTIEEFFKEKTENNECTPEEFILFCYINHELNLLDPLGCAYPSIWFEYFSYAWELVHYRFKNGGKKLQSKVKEQIEYLVFFIGDRDNKTVKTTCHRIIKVVNEIYYRLFYIKKLHKEQFSERIFWEKQLKIFQYKVLGEYRKNYASYLSLLKEEQAHLIKHKDENMAKYYRDFVRLLYINHNLNLLDLTEMYYPQFQYQYEKYAWKILKAYKRSSAKEFPLEAEKIIVEMYEQEGIACNRYQRFQQEKKVLVVCQKRAALDVVYQRLDGLGLSNHIALVHDEKNDRKKLYAKVGAVLEQNQVSFENSINQLSSTSKKLAAQEEILNSIAAALYEHQDFGLRLYDLYGLAKQVADTSQIIDLNEVLPALNKDVIVDISEKVYTYAEWYDRFGDEDFPLKERKTFANFNMKEKLEAIELLNDVLNKAKQAVEYIDSLDHEKITPAYTWLIEGKLEKIYPDLEDGTKRTLQGLRLWWWTSVSGKNIIEELLEGEKFKGTSSSEWLKVKKSLVIMHELGKVTKAMSEEVDKLKKYLHDSKVNILKTRISEGDIPLNEFDKMMEYIHYKKVYLT